MSGWDGWEVGRATLVLSGVMYAGIWVQVSLFHWAGAFKKLAMWGPVLATPLIVGAIAAGAIRRDGEWGWVAAGFLALGVLEGLVGLYYHLRGVRSQIGGFSKRNFLSGPPPILPLAYALIGVVGLTGLLWNA
jgi:hypothetical protein